MSDAGWGMLFSRMAFLVGLQQLIHIEVRVLLGCGEAAVAQELLDPPEVGARIQQVCGKGVAKCVRRDPFLDGGSIQIILQHLPDPGFGKPFPARVQKQEQRILAANQLGANRGIFTQSVQRLVAKEHGSLFSAFAADTDRLLRIIDVADFQGSDFPDAQSRCVQQLKKSPIARRRRRISKLHFQELSHLLQLKHLRKLPGLLWRSDSLCGIRAQVVLPAEKAEEGAHSGKFAGCRAAVKTFCVKMVYKTPDSESIDLLEIGFVTRDLPSHVSAEVFAKLREIVGVSDPRVFRISPFYFEVRLKFIQEFLHDMYNTTNLVQPES